MLLSISFSKSVTFLAKFFNFSLTSLFLWRSVFEKKSLFYLQIFCIFMFKRKYFKVTSQQDLANVKSCKSHSETTSAAVKGWKNVNKNMLCPLSHGLPWTLPTTTQQFRVLPSWGASISDIASKFQLFLTYLSTPLSTWKSIFLFITS